MMMYGERRYGSIILGLSIRWRKVVSFFIPGGRILLYPLARGLVGPTVGLDAME
jgi:hypothetical protein